MRLLLDEMYTSDIAEALRELGHDVSAVAERRDLMSAADTLVFATAQEERRVIVTNNVRDFAPLSEQALQTGATFYGVLFTSDKSMPRRRANIRAYIDVLNAELTQHADDERLPAGVAWLP